MPEVRDQAGKSWLNRGEGCREFCDASPCPSCWCLSWRRHGPRRVERGLSSCYVGICLYMASITIPELILRILSAIFWGFLRKVSYLQSCISSRGKGHFMGCAPTRYLHVLFSGVLESCLFISTEQNFGKRRCIVLESQLFWDFDKWFWGENLEDIINMNGINISN